MVLNKHPGHYVFPCAVKCQPLFGLPNQASQHILGENVLEEVKRNPEVTIRVEIALERASFFIPVQRDEWYDYHFG